MNEEKALVYPQEQMALAGIRKPKEILAEAATAATELTKWMKAKIKPVIFNKEQYPEFEDWQLAGSFYHLTAKVEWTRPIQFGDVTGFEAGANLIDIRTGQVISSAEAMCLNDEENWGKRPKLEWHYVLKDGSKQIETPDTGDMVWEDNPYKPGSKRPKKERLQIGEAKVPLFQLRSMAQTRACAKALRNVLSWIFVLAGFKPGVAEEMIGYEVAANAGDAKEAPIADAKKKDPPQAAEAENGGNHPGPSERDLFNQKMNQKPPAGDDVFTALEKELANYCDGDDAAMQEKLMALTSFQEINEETKKKTGKVIAGKRFVNDLRKAKTGGERWAGSALKKLRDELAGER